MEKSKLSIFKALWELRTIKKSQMDLIYTEGKAGAQACVFYSRYCSWLSGF